MIRIKGLVGIMLLTLPLVGCLDAEYEIDINSDGSGVVSIQYELDERWLPRGEVKQIANGYLPDTFKRWSISSFSEEVVWETPRVEKDGERVRFQVQGYFTDFRSFLPPGHSPIRLQETKEGGWELWTEAGVEEESKEGLRKKKGINLNRLIGGILEAADFRLYIQVKMPGSILESEGWPQVKDRLAVLELRGQDLVKEGSFSKPFRVVCGPPTEEASLELEAWKKHREAARAMASGSEPIQSIVSRLEAALDDLARRAGDEEVQVRIDAMRAELARIKKLLKGP
jgi:hypothetical protein